MIFYFFAFSSNVKSPILIKILLQILDIHILHKLESFLHYVPYYKLFSIIFLYLHMLLLKLFLLTKCRCEENQNSSKYNIEHINREIFSITCFKRIFLVIVSNTSVRLVLFAELFNHCLHFTPWHVSTQVSKHVNP